MTLFYTLCVVSVAILIMSGRGTMISLTDIDSSRKAPRMIWRPSSLSSEFREDSLSVPSVSTVSRFGSSFPLPFVSDFLPNNFVIGGIARDVTIFTKGDNALVIAETGPVNLRAMLSGLFVPQSWPMVCVTSTITRPAAADRTSPQGPSYNVLPNQQHYFWFFFLMN